MNSFIKRIKKVSAFESEVIERFDCLQHSEATLRSDIRQILREELKNLLTERNRKGWWQLA